MGGCRGARRIRIELLVRVAESKHVWGTFLDWIKKGVVGRIKKSSWQDYICLDGDNSRSLTRQ